MNKKVLWILAAILTLCGINNVQAQTLRGTVTDALTGEALIGATVKITELQNAATVTDAGRKFRSTWSRAASTEAALRQERHLAAQHFLPLRLLTANE